MCHECFRRRLLIGGWFVLGYAVWSLLAFAEERPRDLPPGQAEVAEVMSEMAAAVDNQLQAKQVKRLAVVEFGAEGPKGTMLGGKIGAAGKYFAMLTEVALVKLAGDHYKVIDRSRVEDVLRETDFQLSDIVRREGLERFNKMEPVDVLVTGTVLRMGPNIQVAMKAIAVPSADSLAMETAAVKVTPDLAALFGESWQGPWTGGPSATPAGEEPARPQPVHPLADAAGVPYQVQMVMGGQALPFHLAGRELFVPAVPGKSYHIRLKNNSERTVAVAVLVDGLNTIGQERELPSTGPKWVLKPGQTLEVPGWQKDMMTAREFVFVKASESLAARKRFCDQIGLITAAFYPEKPGQPDSTSKSLVGTGEGQAVDFKVRQVRLNYDPTPAAVLSIRYDLPDVVNEMKKLKR